MDHLEELWLPQEVMTGPAPAHAQGAWGTGGVESQGGRGAGVCSLNKVPRGFCYLFPHTLENCFSKPWHYLLSPISLSHSSSNWLPSPCWLPLKNTSHIWFFLSIPTAPNLIISCRDCCCNRLRLLAGLWTSRLSGLQSILHTAARLTF